MVILKVMRSLGEATVLKISSGTFLTMNFEFDKTMD